MARLWWAVAAMCLAGEALAQSPRVLWAGADPDSPATASQPAERAAPLPGVTIDRQRRRVMVECRSLQPGVPLELVACKPHTRDHEAILQVQARPQHVHLALLLCGFEPGQPASWDEKTEKPIPAAGERLDIHMQWTDPKTSRQRTVPIDEWLGAIDPARPLPPLNWIFTGSRQFEDGQYWADLEGSVVSISNFPDAVIDLEGVHTRDDTRLEFKGNERVMPPAGTRCVMILLPPAVLSVGLDRFGKVTVAGKAVLPERLADRLAAHRRCRDDARVELVVSPEAVKADVDRLLARLAEAGFPADRIQRRAPATQPGASVFPTNDPRAAIDLLTGQFRQGRLTIERNLAAQRQWFDQLDDRRQVLTGQYRELADYIGRAREQYRQKLAELRARP